MLSFNWMWIKSWQPTLAQWLGFLIELKLFRLLPYLQSCLNYITAQTWTIDILLSLPFLVQFQSRRPTICFALVTSFYLLLQITFSQTSWNPVAVSLTRPLYLALILTHGATATLLPSSDCIMPPAPSDASGETKNLFDSLRRFHFTVAFCSFSHIPSFFTVDGEHHFVLLKEREEDLPWEPVAPSAPAWWLQWVSRFCILPTPPCFAYLHSSLLFPPDCSLFEPLRREIHRALV